MALERPLIRPVADVRELDPTTDTAELATIDYAGAMAIGGTNATSLALGKIGITTTILGDLQVDGTTTLVDTVTAQGDVNLGDGGDTITIGSGTDTIILNDDLDVAAGVLIDLSASGGYITLPDQTQATATDGSDGYLRLNVSGAPDVLQFLDLGGTTWVTVGYAGSVTLDDAYDGAGAGAGRAITADSGAVTITVSDTSNNLALILTQNDVTNNPDALEISNAGSGDALVFSGAGTRSIVSDAANLSMTTTTSGDLVYTSAGGVTITSARGIDLDAGLNVEINSTGGAINIGNDADNNSIDLGTAGTRTISIGSTSATAVNITTGTDIVVSAGSNLAMHVASTGAVGFGIAPAVVGTGEGTVVIGDIASTSATSNFGIVLADTSTTAGFIDITLNNTILSLNTLSGSAKTMNLYNGSGSAAGNILVQLDQNGRVYVRDGSNALPSFSFLNGATSGMYWNNGSSRIEWSVGTTKLMHLYNSGFDVDIGAGGISLDATTDSNLTVSGSAQSLTLEVSGGGAQKVLVQSAGTGADAVHINASGGGVDIDSVSGISLDSTGPISLDTSAAANVSTSSSGDGDRLTLESTNAGNQGVSILSSGTISNAIKIHASNASGGIDVDCGTSGFILDTTGGISLDAATNSNFTITANDGADQTLLFAVSNAGAGDGIVSIDADSVNIANGVFRVAETTTPTAQANYGAYYTKSDNIPYFQDGAGNEKALATSDANYGSMYLDDNSTATTIETAGTPIMLRNWTAGSNLSNWTFDAGSTGAITAYSDGTTVTNVASAGHGLSTGDIISIRGTTNYNGVHEITYINASSFSIAVAFAGDDGASDWDQGSYIEAGTGAAGTYGVEWSMSSSEQGAAGSTVDFVIYKNDTAQTEGALSRKFSNNDVGAMGSGCIITIADGDIVSLTASSSGTNTITNQYGNIRVRRL
jgi:hypothetical protein